MEKILTISVAAYNVSEYIEQTLRSIVHASYLADLEILVVDDGSQDETPEIVSGFSREYPDSIKLIKKENGGYGSTINASLREASGKYYKLLDGDDWVDPNELDKLIEELRVCDTDMVLSGYVQCFEGDGRRERVGYSNLDGGDYSLSDICQRHSLKMHEIAFRTEVLRRMGLHITENCYYTDTEFALKPLVAVEDVHCCDAYPYMYRLGREGQSMEMRSWVKNIDQAIKVSLGLAEYYSNVVDSAKISPEVKSYLFDCVSQSCANKFRIMLYMPIAKTTRERIQYFRDLLESHFPEVYQRALSLSMTMRLICGFKCGLYYVGAVLIRVKHPLRLSSGD